MPPKFEGEGMSQEGYGKRVFVYGHPHNEASVTHIRSVILPDDTVMCDTVCEMTMMNRGRPSQGPVTEGGTKANFTVAEDPSPKEGPRQRVDHDGFLILLYDRLPSLPSMRSG